MSRLLIIGSVCFLQACFPEFEDRPYLVGEPTILAIRSTPAEARPNADIALEALVATPSGTIESAPVEWSVCLRARRTEERTSVTATCLGGDDLEPVESNTTVLADACARFGPVPPPTEGDADPLRPTDPDPTGGYFLPVRASVTPEGGSEVTAFGFVRIRCDLAGATRSIFMAYQEQYKENTNPALGEIRLNDEVATELSATSDGTVELTLQPPAAATEPFVVYSAEDGVLYDREERLTAFWYVSAGSVTVASQSLTGEEVRAGKSFASQFVPDGAGTVHGWVVLRDERGGSDWSSFTISVN